MAGSVRRLRLHVGLPKTGTTALQRWLAGNPDALATTHTVYPAGRWRTRDKHQFMVAELRAGAPVSLPALLEDAEVSTVLLSTEGFTNHLHDFPAAALAEFRDVTRGLEVDALLVTRAAAGWLASYYKQCVINPRNGASALYGTGLSLDDFARQPRVRQLLDVDALHTEVAEAYGAVRVHRLAYENDWFTGALDWLGLRHGPRPAPPRAHETPPDWVVETVLALNRAGIPEPRRDWWKGRLAVYTGSGHAQLLDARDRRLDAEDTAGLRDDLALMSRLLARAAGPAAGFPAFAERELRLLAVP
jgi:hypothetical protein